jgi:hypothetical protein
VPKTVGKKSNVSMAPDPYTDWYTELATVSFDEEIDSIVTVSSK